MMSKMYVTDWNKLKNQKQHKSGLTEINREAAKKFVSQDEFVMG